jgi:hypothetical protein
MVLLSKEQALYKNNGVNLEPIEVKLITPEKEKDSKKEIYVKLIPMTRQELKTFYTLAEETENKDGTESKVVSTKDGDAELIAKHIIEPSFTKKELEFLKPKISRNLVYTILHASEQDISSLLNLETSLKENIKKNSDENK